MSASACCFFSVMATCTNFDMYTYVTLLKLCIYIDLRFNVLSIYLSQVSPARRGSVNYVLCQLLATLQIKYTGCGEKQSLIVEQKATEARNLNGKRSAHAIFMCH